MLENEAHINPGERILSYHHYASQIGNTWELDPA